MTKSLPIILGIDPGAGQIGVSVFYGEELVFYAVKTFKMRSRKDSLKKLDKIIETLIKTYQIDYVALEKVVFIQQHRSFVKIVFDEIKTHLKKQNVEFSEYNPKSVRQAICGLEKPTKHNTALLLSQKYMELTRYFNVPRLWQKRYYAQLFDAIAVGFVCAEELRQKKLFEAQPLKIKKH